MRKITVEVPAETLDAVLRDGGSLAENVREALRDLAHKRASRRLLELQGKVKFDMSWEELRGKDET